MPFDLMNSEGRLMTKDFNDIIYFFLN